ncbi:MAG: IgGFc-binding protein [Polyangiales bacterium]
MASVTTRAGLWAVAVSALACSGNVRSVEDGGVARDNGTPVVVDPLDWIDCQPGQERCYQNIHQRCLLSGELTRVENEDCAAQLQVCADTLWCVTCRPGELRCTGDSLGVERCLADGSGWEHVTDCDTSRGEACRRGQCVVLCNDDSIQQSYFGCEYYGVDLDNIVETGGRSAASQQYSIVVSNPDPVLTVRVEIHRNNAAPGEPPQLERVRSAVIPPQDLEVFELPAREVDCSTVAGFNDGTGTCLSSRAYRVTSTYPVIAYQFNPLENVGVFSNDASLLLPTNSLQGNYRVLGYPQQWSETDNPDTNGRDEIRAYMTIVGTQPNTRVRVTPTADIIPGGPFTTRHPAGTPFDIILNPFDVLNLETGAFLADFTGSFIQPDRPVAVFSGTECTDVPFWRVISDRQSACDHIEEQLFPAATAGQNYVAARLASRTRALFQAGATVAQVNEPEWFRVLNPGTAIVHVTTTLPVDVADPDGPRLEFDLDDGQYRDIRALADFTMRGDAPIIVGQFMGSQSTAGIASNLPGGDPALLIVPPTEQWRTDYVVLTPNKYAFDFVTLVSRPRARIFLDNTPVDDFADCTRSRADGCVDSPTSPCPEPVFVTYRCQLSFPRVDNSVNPPVITAGRQRDGVHVIRSEVPAGQPPEGVMVLVSGFDAYVSYAYAGGTNLTPVR